ncbi:MAG: gamma-glutamylcyclotransferase family protein [Candidatus Onthomonas sp.]
MEEKLYFAYGSNINLDQMAYRCPDAKVVGPVMLEDYELLFRGNGGGNGVATIAPKQGSYVYGLLWKLTPACEKSLDRYEGYPHLYAKKGVTVWDTEGQRHTVMAYVMTNLPFREPAMPSSNYYYGIKAGFRQNGLPLKALDKAFQQVRQEVTEREQQRPPWHYSNQKKKYPRRER